MWGSGAAVAACRLEAPSCIHRHVLSRWRYSPTALQLQVAVPFGGSLLLGLSENRRAEPLARRLAMELLQKQRWLFALGVLAEILVHF